MVDVRFQVKLIIGLIVVLTYVEMIYWTGHMFVGLRYWKNAFSFFWQIGMGLKIGLSILLMASGLLGYIGLHEKKRSWLKPFNVFLIISVMANIFCLPIMWVSGCWISEQPGQFVPVREEACIFRHIMTVGVSTMPLVLSIYYIGFVLCTTTWDLLKDDAQELSQQEEKEV